MSPRSAQIKILDGSSITSPIEQWPHGEELIESQLSVKNVSSGKAVSIFQILRCDNLMGQNQLRQIGRILTQCFHHRVTQRYALTLPIAVLQLVRSILHVNGH